MEKIKKETILYIIICLIISNVCWYLSCKIEEEIIKILLISLASFTPMILALIFIKIYKGNYKELGFRLNIKESWKIYLLSFIISIFISYIAVPLMLLIFNGKVSINFTQETFIMLILTPIFGTITSIEMMGEEIGWIGYLYPKLEKMTNTIFACIILGIIRGIYHLGLIIFTDYPIYGLIEIIVTNILLSYLSIYMFKKSKSLFPICLVHSYTNIYPIIIAYDNKWYYTSILPMIISIIPLIIIAIYFINLMKKENLLKR